MVADSPAGTTSGGSRLKTVRFDCSGESPPVTGTTVAVEVASPAVAVTVADENKSALSKVMVT
jgi:hypothetical protein